MISLTSPVLGIKDELAGCPCSGCRGGGRNMAMDDLEGPRQNS